MVAQEWCFLWDNAPVHMATVIQHWFAATASIGSSIRPYAGPGSADFFLFKRVKEELAGKTLEATLEQVFQSIAL
jgi:hypothetical protein